MPYQEAALAPCCRPYRLGERLSRARHVVDCAAVPGYFPADRQPRCIFIHRRPRRELTVLPRTVRVRCCDLWMATQRPGHRPRRSAARDGDDPEGRTLLTRPALGFLVGTVVIRVNAGGRFAEKSLNLIPEFFVVAVAMGENPRADAPAAHDDKDGGEVIT
jgi:hypothetical protein